MERSVNDGLPFLWKTVFVITTTNTIQKEDIIHAKTALQWTGSKTYFSLSRAVHLISWMNSSMIEGAALLTDLTSFGRSFWSNGESGH
jgi:predicted homoserine dehydrogenase-like protein